MLFCPVFNKGIHFLAIALSSAIFVHAEIINIKCLNIRKAMTVLYFINDTIQMADDFSLGKTDKDRSPLITQQCQKLFIGIFFRIWFKDVGSTDMVHPCHLI